MNFVSFLYFGSCGFFAFLGFIELHKKVYKRTIEKILVFIILFVLMPIVLGYFVINNRTFSDGLMDLMNFLKLR